MIEIAAVDQALLVATGIGMVMVLGGIFAVINTRHIESSYRHAMAGLAQAFAEEERTETKARSVGGLEEDSFSDWHMDMSAATADTTLYGKEIVGAPNIWIADPVPLRLSTTGFQRFKVKTRKAGSYIFVGMPRAALKDVEDES